MAQAWTNKEDVLKDLEVAMSGQVVDVEDRYILYGDQPPLRPPVDSEDDEIELRFGPADSQELGPQDVLKPDLMGITEMLRMVQNYDNSSDDELSVTQNQKIVIMKPNISKPPSLDKMRVNLEHQDPNILPNNIVVAGKVNLFEAQPSGSDKIALHSRFISNERETGDNIVSNSTPNASKELHFSEPNGGASGDQYWPYNELTISSNSYPLASSVKLNTNNNTLNPYVKEFIPKSAQVAFSQSFKTKEENVNKIHVIDSQNNDTSVTKFEQEVDKSESVEDVTVVKNDDSSKEIKNQKANMLKNHISTKNNTFEEQQQTNRVIVNFPKDSYSYPKPLKLLTPQFFERSKADSSIEQTAEHSDKKTNVTPFEKRDAESKNNCNAPAKNALNVNYDLTIKKDTYNKENYSEKFWRQHTLDMGVINIDDRNVLNVSETDVTDPYIKESISKINSWLQEKPVVTFTEKSKSDCNAPAKNALNVNYDLIIKEDTYDKKNYSEEFKANTICNESKDIEELNEFESTQHTLGMGVINLDDRNVLNSSETDITDSLIKESISKVNNWLQEKPVVTFTKKSKSPILYPGLLRYTKKESVTCKSREVTEKEVPKAGEYKPSSYADELHKKYSQNNSNQKPPTLNIWEKLDADLKKKDLEIKNRKKKPPTLNIWEKLDADLKKKDLEIKNRKKKG